MSNAGNDNRTYTAADIARYHDGEMSAREMYALERAALEDPFLADALEGLATRSGAGFTKEMGMLKDRLARKIAGKKKRLAFPVYRLGIAAAVFLLAGSLSVIYFINQGEDGSRQILVQEKRAVTQDTSDEYAPDSLSSLSQTKDKKTIVTKQGEFKKREKLEQPAPQALSPTEMMDKSALAEARPAIPTVDTPHQRETDASLSMMMTKAKAEPSEMKRDSGSSKEAVRSRPVAGRAVNSAPVRSQKVAQAKVDNTAMQKTAPVASNLVPTMPVVAPYGIRDESLFGPLTGWSAYAEYFRNNLSSKPEFANLQGEMVIGFRIDKSGLPKDIRIEKTLSPALDRESLRLLEAGSKWKITSGMDRSVKISILF